MTVARLYADADGVTHFGAVELPLETKDFTPPAPPIDISAFQPAARYAFLTVAPGWNGIEHPAPVRSLFVFLGGRWEIAVGDGEVRVFGPGETLLVEDTAGPGHSTRLLDDAPGSALLIQLPD
ncbi:MAG: cupin domain-containing protein [Acidobacteria bacterium]|nr:cupin domain-containing protein [Acidobacteriota bacterium]